MGLRQALISLLTPAPKADADARAAAPMREAAGVTRDEDRGWTRLSADTNRDLDPYTHRRMQEMAVYLWKTNPLANRLIELPLAFLLAEGCRATVPDDEAQQWLEDFWDDPINEMAIKLPKKVRDLSLFGEQCWPTFVDQFTGHVRLGYLDPDRIGTVIVDPDNVEQRIAVITKPDKKGATKRYRIIVNGRETVFGEKAREIRETCTDGDCFYFAINDLSSSARGHSDLLAVTDWLDGLSNSMFGDLDRWDMQRAFIWDVKLLGATPEEVAQRAKQIVAPSQGSVRVRNESEEWSAISPDLGAVESESFAKLFRNWILGGVTLPSHWFADGGDVNRASATEMGEPTFKVLTMKQTFLGYILRSVLKYQIRMRLQKLGLEDLIEEDDYKPDVIWPDLTAKDTSKYSNALQQVTVACCLLIDKGLITRAEAVNLIALIFSQLGLKVDPEEMLEAAAAEAAARREEDTFSAFGNQAPAAAE